MTPSQVNVQRALAQYRSPADLARALGTSRQHVKRLQEGTVPGVKMTIRLARINGDDPVRALQQSGHHEAAEDLKAIYGEVGRDKLTAAQRELLAIAADMDDEDRRHYLALGRSLSGRRKKR